MVGIGFEDSVARTLLAIPNTNTKVNSKDVPTAIQPQKDSAASRKLDIDHDDDETSSLDGEDAGADEHPLLVHIAGRLPDLHPGRPGAEPHAGFGREPASLGAARGGTPAGYAKSTLIQMQAYGKKLPPLGDTAAQDGPYATILALRREFVIQIEEVLSQRGSCSTRQRGCSASRSRPCWRRPRRTSGRGL